VKLSPELEARILAMPGTRVNGAEVRAPAPPQPPTFASPLADSLVGTEVCRVSLIGEPRSKGRPRLAAGRVHTDRKTARAEEAIRRQLLVAKVKPDADHLLGVEVTFRAGSGQRRDLDNQIKLLLDACNGYVWRDDFQVIELHAKSIRKSSDVGTELTVRRLQRYTRDCATCGVNIGSDPGWKKRFCSRPCYDKWQRRDGKYSPCTKCNEPVYQSPTNVGVRGRKPWCNKCRGTKSARLFCKRGHSMENALVRANGDRLCRVCNTNRARKHRGVPLR